MNKIIIDDVKSQLKRLPQVKLKALIKGLGLNIDLSKPLSEVNLNLISLHAIDDVFTASLHGVNVKQERGVTDYFIDNIDSLEVDEAREIISTYLDLSRVEFSKESDALVIILSDNEDEKDEVRGVVDYIYNHVEEISSSQMRQILVKYFSEWKDILFDPLDVDIVIA